MSIVIFKLIVKIAKKYRGNKFPGKILFVIVKIVVDTV